MQMDYQGYQASGHERMHDNLFYSPMRSIGMDVALMTGGWGAIKYGKHLHSSAIELTKLANKMSSGLGNLPGTKKSMARGVANSKVKGSMAWKSAGKSLKRFGHAFGLVGVTQLFFEAASALGGASSAFATTREEMDKARYQRNYDQDTYYDTRAAYTQRQRALQVIHNSRQSLSPVLGNESSYLHN